MVEALSLNSLTDQMTSNIENPNCFACILSHFSASKYNINSKIFLLYHVKWSKKNKYT